MSQEELPIIVQDDEDVDDVMHVDRLSSPSTKLGDTSSTRYIESEARWIELVNYLREVAGTKPTTVWGTPEASLLPTTQHVRKDTLHIT